MSPKTVKKPDMKVTDMRESAMTTLPVTDGNAITRMMRVLITPEFAKYILANHNGNNRTLAPSTVESYARDMKAGRWQYTGDAIKFTAKPRTLTNGQHRLAACVASGVPMVIDVLLDVPADSVMVEDTGRSRSVADVVALVSKTAESINVSRLRALRNGFVQRRTKFTVSDFQLLRKHFARGTELVGKLLTSRTGLGRAPVAAAFIIVAQADPQRATRLLEALINGNANSQAEKALHRYLLLAKTIDPEDVTMRKVLGLAFSDDRKNAVDDRSMPYRWAVTLNKLDKSNALIADYIAANEKAYGDVPGFIVAPTRDVVRRAA